MAGNGWGLQQVLRGGMCLWRRASRQCFLALAFIALRCFKRQASLDCLFGGDCTFFFAGAGQDFSAAAWAQDSRNTLTVAALRFDKIECMPSSSWMVLAFISLAAFGQARTCTGRIFSLLCEQQLKFSAQSAKMHKIYISIQYFQIYLSSCQEPRHILHKFHQLTQ